jgi:peptide/bleomycin uptake transporter
MFKSFFPNPKLFFPSLVLWSIISITLWYLFNQDIGSLVGLNLEKAEPIIGLGHFYTDSFILFYFYYTASVLIFAIFWMLVSPHPWQNWSIFGSAAILFSTYFSVQISVALNQWRRPFFDAVQQALSGKLTVSTTTLYDLTIIFVQIAFMFIIVYVVTRFFVSHYIFRWRIAMNDYYTERWSRLRHIEGASQRIQEDTMRFAQIMENLGVAMVDSVMTLFAFLPILLELSVYVKNLPIVGIIPYPLFIASIVWSLFGTGLLAIVGIKLPGLEFKNQRVEAAYRKELVHGEDSENRAQPMTLMELFDDVRRNYFRLYFHYMYFNIARSLYIQADNIFAYIILVPTIAAGTVTYGILQRILTAFTQVSSSFQYLVNSWPQIVDLLSVYKRLAAFEASIKGKPLPTIDSTYEFGVSDK